MNVTSKFNKLAKKLKDFDDNFAQSLEFKSFFQLIVEQSCSKIMSRSKPSAFVNFNNNEMRSISIEKVGILDFFCFSPIHRYVPNFCIRIYYVKARAL